MDLPAHEFNSRAETYYREESRAQQIEEAFGYLREDLERLTRDDVIEGNMVRECLHYCLDQRTLAELLEEMEDKIPRDQGSEEGIRKLINLLLLSITHDRAASRAVLGERKSADSPTLPH